jgi:hypothetical protein
MTYSICRCIAKIKHTIGLSDHYKTQLNQSLFTRQTDNILVLDNNKKNQSIDKNVNVHGTNRE